MDFTRYDQKLEFILRTAARIFAEKGYHTTSMRDIARETGVSLAGLYYYCKSKEELLLLIQEHCFGRVAGRLAERLQETSEPVEKLRVFIENHLSFFAADMAEMKVLSHEADALTDEMYEQVAVTKQNYTQLARHFTGSTGTRAAPGDASGCDRCHLRAFWDDELDLQLVRPVRSTGCDGVGGKRHAPLSQRFRRAGTFR